MENEGPISPLGMWMTNNSRIQEDCESVKLITEDNLTKLKVIRISRIKYNIFRESFKLRK